MRKIDTQKIGAEGEKMARKFLESIGLVFLEANFHCRGGEIDLIFRDGKILVFVEVKRRTNEIFGDPIEAVTPKKAARLFVAIERYFLDRFLDEETPFRVDLVAISQRDGQAQIDHRKDFITQF